MTRSPVISASVALMLVLPFGSVVRAQNADTARLSARREATPFHLEVGGFLQSLDRGYGTWRGGDVRLQWASPRLTPFAFVSTQTRDAAGKPGTQENYGVGSYVTLTPWLYTIVGVSTAPDNGIILYPKLRTDASLIGALPGIRGLLLSAGLTTIRYAQGAGGSITSVGPIYYRGHGIYSGVLRFNRDRASGAASHSFLVGGQYGVQGKYWVGASAGGGNEAYQVLGATPFDARFESRGASVFAQRWITRRQGLALRFEVENKLHTYHRNGASLSYFIDF